MTRLEKLFAALQHSLGVQRPLRDRAARRMRARHAEQAKFERQQHRAEDSAEALRKKGHIAKAARLEAKAQKLEAKAEAQKRKAIVWKSRTRKLTQRIEGITHDAAKVQKEIAAAGATIDFEKSLAVGGSDFDRWMASNLTAVECCSKGRRRNAYSQSGTPDIWHPFGPGPASDHRDDCSTYGKSMCRAAQLDDPSGIGFDSGEGFTGSMLLAKGRWKEVSLSEMISHGWGFIIYGGGSGHHTEMYVPSKTDKMRTVGHGSAPVDFGTVHIFGSGEIERYFIFA